jgi:hypothetical protein
MLEPHSFALLCRRPGRAPDVLGLAHTLPPILRKPLGHIAKVRLKRIGRNHKLPPFYGL